MANATCPDARMADAASLYVSMLSEWGVQGSVATRKMLLNGRGHRLDAEGGLLQ
jgi:hypothetical protein